MYLPLYMYLPSNAAVTFKQATIKCQSPCLNLALRISISIRDATQSPGKSPIFSSLKIGEGGG